MTQLAIKKDRLVDLLDLGFKKEGNMYVYENTDEYGKAMIIVMEDYPLIHCCYFDMDMLDDSLSDGNIPDIVLDLFEAGLVERFEYD